MADAKGDTLGGFAAKAAAITTILGFLIGLPSLLFTWNNQANERARAFAQAVELEEARWNKLFDHYYVALADRETAGRMSVAEARFQVLCRLAVDSSVPDFGHFPLPGEGSLGLLFPEPQTPRHVEARQRVAGLKAELIKLLETASLSTPAAAACVRWQRDDKAAEPLTTRQRVPALTGAPAATAVPPAVTAAVQAQTMADVVQAPAALPQQPLNPLQQPGSVTLSAGKPNGWDVDVFWCEGHRAADNLRLADAAARKLVEARATTLPIGRVRLRLLTLDRQRDPGYRPVGLEIRGEAREQAIAEQLSADLGAGGAQFRFRQSSKSTPWYLSLFACQS